MLFIQNSYSSKLPDGDESLQKDEIGSFIMAINNTEKACDGYCFQLV